MEPIEFEVTLTDEVFVARAGLPLAGQLLSRTQLHERLDRLKVADAANPTIGRNRACMLIRLYTGPKPTRRTWEMVC